MIQTTISLKLTPSCSTLMERVDCIQEIIILMSLNSTLTCLSKWLFKAQCYLLHVVFHDITFIKSKTQSHAILKFSRTSSRMRAIVGLCKILFHTDFRQLVTIYFWWKCDPYKISSFRSLVRYLTLRYIRV